MAGFVVFVPLTKGKVYKVDIDSYNKLPRGWIAQTAGQGHYAAKRYNGKLRLMHREILGAKKGEYVDHINGDRLDNRLSNLRICTNAENVRNSKLRKGSRYKGVTKQKTGYYARITYNNKCIYLGRFKTAVEAAEAYDIKAKELFGEFSRTNKEMNNV